MLYDAENIIFFFIHSFIKINIINNLFAHIYTYINILFTILSLSRVLRGRGGATFINKSDYYYFLVVMIL